MAKEATFISDLEELGYHPIENRAIVLRFQPENLSGEIANFFSANNYFVLQLCEEQAILLPVINNWLGTFETKKTDLLKITYASIQDVTLIEDKLNYILTIVTDDQTMIFRLQQKELSSLRASGGIGSESNFWGTKTKNWHQENFDDTLSDLLAFSQK